MTLEGIRDIFNLDEGEMVYESFNCYQTCSMRRSGKVYITDENICYYCSLIGFESKSNHINLPKSISKPKNVL